MLTNLLDYRLGWWIEFLLFFYAFGFISDAKSVLMFLGSMGEIVFRR